MCCISWHPKISFYRVIGKVIVSSFCRCCACLWWWFSLLLINLFFYFFLFHSSKITTWPSWLLIFQFQSLLFLFLIFYIGPFVEISFVFFSFFNPNLTNNIFSNFFFSFLRFSIFYLSHFVKVFNFIIQFKIMVLYF